MQFLRTLNDHTIAQHHVGAIGPRFEPGAEPVYKAGPAREVAFYQPRRCRKCMRNDIAHHHVEDVNGNDYSVSAREVSRFLKACEAPHLAAK